MLLEVKATRYCVLLQGFDDQRLKQSNVRSNGGLLREHIKISLETMMKWSVLQQDTIVLHRFVIFNKLSKDMSP